MPGRYNEILEGRYNRLLQKLFGMKGGPPAPQLASEIMTVIPVMHGRENRYLEAWRTFGSKSTQAGVAAQDTVARLVNPPGPNIIAVVESIKIAMGVANAEAVFEFTNTVQTALTNISANAAFDKRDNPADVGNNGSQLTLSTANNIGQGSHVVFDDLQLATAGQTSLELINYENQEIVMLPGSSLQIRSLTLNVAMVTTIRWRERLLGESERT